MVNVDYTLCIFPCQMYGGMEDKTSFGYAKVCAATVSNVSFCIYFYQGGSSYFIVQKAKRIYEEVLFIFGGPDLKCTIETDWTGFYYSVLLP